MNIKLKIILAIVIPAIIAYIVAVIFGEHFAVEGWNSLILWFVPIISIFFIVLKDMRKK